LAETEEKFSKCQGSQKGIVAQNEVSEKKHLNNLKQGFNELMKFHVQRKTMSAENTANSSGAVPMPGCFNQKHEFGGGQRDHMHGRFPQPEEKNEPVLNPELCF